MSEFRVAARVALSSPPHASCIRLVNENAQSHRHCFVSNIDSIVLFHVSPSTQQISPCETVPLTAGVGSVLCEMWDQSESESNYSEINLFKTLLEFRYSTLEVCRCSILDAFSFRWRWRRNQEPKNFKCFTKFAPEADNQMGNAVNKHRPGTKWERAQKKKKRN